MKLRNFEYDALSLVSYKKNTCMCLYEILIQKKKKNIEILSISKFIQDISIDLSKNELKF